MEPALILADQIVTLLRQSGATKMEAHAALSIANEVLTSIGDMKFRSDFPEPAEPAAP
jgi:hypothetical protein